MENIETGLMLMLVGMCTVFIILLIVIWLSTLLIKAVNKLAPLQEEVKSSTKNVVQNQSSVDSNTSDAIKAAVGIITSGKGTVVKIEKI